MAKAPLAGTGLLEGVCGQVEGCGLPPGLDAVHADHYAGVRQHHSEAGTFFES